MRKFITIALVLLALAGLAGGVSACGSSDADVASHNLSTAAEQFEVPRRIVFYNGITDKIMLTVEGYCSIETPEFAGKLEVTCKVQVDGKSQYFKDYLGLSDNVTYITQQLEPTEVSTTNYRVIIKPGAAIPDFELR